MIQTVIWGVVVVLSIVNLSVIVLVLRRLKVIGKVQSERSAQDQLRSLHEQVSRLEQEIRDEIRNTQTTISNTVVTNIGEFGNNLTTQVEGMRTTADTRFQHLQQSIETRLDKIRETVTNQLKSTADTLVNTVGELGKSQETQLENVRKTVHDRLEAMQTSNEKKLDQMRNTVDEKLQSTLDKRLGESFSRVSERLEKVQRGLGEMKDLAADVGNLKQVLTNVKDRGTWGEYQLGALLEDILTPDQYDANVRTSENSQEQVEYAIRLPGRDDKLDSYVWLPIDSKFPRADYDRLIEAANDGNRDELQKAVNAFLNTVQSEARKISSKYIDPPQTTDFAIMFMPTEGLYAEVLRAPGQVMELFHRYRIMVAGPTTLGAFLNTLRVGFRTLAIEKRSSEVWKILSAVKTEFGKFGNVMQQLKKQLKTASNTVDRTQTRTQAMAQQLTKVEELPPGEASALFQLSDTETAVYEVNTHPAD